MQCKIEGGGMEQPIIKPITQTDSARQSDALLLARLEVEAQCRLVRRLTAGLTVFLLVWLAGLLYIKQPSLFQRWQSTVRVQTVTPKPADAGEVEQLSQELTRLKLQLGKAVTETLSIKLAALEERIRMGQAGLQDLELIQSIKEDIGLLTARGGQRPMVAVTPGFQPEAVPVLDAALLERFSRLETLVYLSLGTFALVAIAAGGYCFRCTIQLKRLEMDLSRLYGQLLSQRSLT